MATLQIVLDEGHQKGWFAVTWINWLSVRAGHPIARYDGMDEESLTQGELDRFWSILTARVAELEEVLRCRELLAIEHNPDDEDEVQQASDRALAISNFDRESRHLRDTRDAISRLGSGSFGVCEQCGERIHRRRLFALPWTAFCVQCQEELDGERRHIHGSGLDEPEHLREADAA